MSEEIAKYQSQSLLDMSIIKSQLLEVTEKTNAEPIFSKVNKHAGNSKYLPISFLEMKLDELFFGLWQTKNFKTTAIANELVGEMELSYFHPVALQWITRVGAAAVIIRQEKGAEITDISKKIKNALVMDVPHLKAECFRNACLSIGKAFGRDLNREFTAEYNPEHYDKITKPQAKELKDFAITKDVKKVQSILAEYGYEKIIEIDKDNFDIIYNRINEL